MSDQTIGLISGMTHLVLSLLLAIATAYGSFRIVGRVTREAGYLDGLKSNNAAIGILTGGVLLSTAFIVNTATKPAISALQVFLFHEFTWISLGKFLAMLIGYVSLSFVFAHVAVGVGMRSFLWLTHDLDELAEIENRNLAVAITIGVTLVIMGLFVADGLASLLQALIPVPVYQTVEVFGG